MSDLAELEARVKVLEDIEAIKRLKYRYFRCLDKGQWEELAECFTEDAVTSYSGGKYSFQGVEDIIGFLKRGLGADHIAAIHHGHHPEIDISGGTTATGTWALYGYRIDTRHQHAFRHGALYHDEYVKEGGRWKIKSTGYVNILEELWQRDPAIETSLG